MDLIKKARVRQFIKENGKHITSIDSGFYVVLEVRLANMILAAIRNNASRKRLSPCELAGNGNGGNALPANAKEVEELRKCRDELLALPKKLGVIE